MVAPSSAATHQTILAPGTHSTELGQGRLGSASQIDALLSTSSPTVSLYTPRSNFGKACSVAMVPGTSRACWPTPSSSLLVRSSTSSFMSQCGPSQSPRTTQDLLFAEWSRRRCDGNGDPSSATVVGSGLQSFRCHSQVVSTSAASVGCLFLESVRWGQNSRTGR